MKLAELDMDKVYTYADYFKWQFEERVELIKGRIFKMSPAPSRLHQKLSSRIHYAFSHFLRDKVCEVYSAPFDVRIPRKSREDKDINTVVQPDICVICDLSKLDDRGCIGAPDIVVEILSPSNNKKELKYKYDVYEETGVKEYWVVMPTEPAIIIYTLTDGRYVSSRMLIGEDIAVSSVLQGFSISVAELFDSIA